MMMARGRLEERWSTRQFTLWTDGVYRKERERTLLDLMKCAVLILLFDRVGLST